MCVGNLQDFENALNGPVFTHFAMQSIESDIGLQLTQPLRNIAIDINLGDAETLVPQRFCASSPRAQRDFALC
jgi:hypothetical protein